MKRYLLVGAAIGLSLAALSCQAPTPPPSESIGADTSVAGPTAPDKVKRGGILRGTWSGTLAHLDLHQVGTLGTWNAGNLMYNGLIEWDAFDKTQQRIVPGLAKSWEASPDGSRFTFRLQDGVKFHDGASLTGDDVVFTLKRIADPPRGTSSARKDQFQMVDKIESPDPQTVVVTTKFPSANLVNLLADGWHVIVPKHVVERDANALKQGGIGTGPYTFKELVPNQKFVAARNPAYFRQGHPYLEGIELYRFGEETTAIAALVTNQLDMVNPAGQGISGQGARDVKARNAAMVVESNPRLAIDIWRYNVTRPPLDDLRVRQAMNLAINREEYVKFLQDSEGPVGTVVFPGSVWDLPKAEQEKLIGYEPNYDQRLQRAKQLLAEAGLAGGFTVTLMATTTNFEDNAQALEAMLGRINIKIKRDPLQQEEARQREAESLFDVYAGGYGIATIDPVGVVGDHFVCGSGRNTSKFCDPELDRLYQEQLKVLDQKERAKVVHEMIKRAINGASMNIINWNNEYHARWPYVRDFVVTPSRYTLASKLEYVWLDK